MRKKYPDCQMEGSVCPICSLVNYGRDCHNKKITSLEWYRYWADMTQQKLADASGINIRTIQKIESGEIDINNMSAKNFMALAEALNVDPNLLLK